jgi:hypothetical protein
MMIIVDKKRVSPIKQWVEKSFMILKIIIILRIDKLRKFTLFKALKVYVS